MISNRAKRRREVKRKQMSSIGNLLLDAIALGRQFEYEYSRRPNEELLRKRQNCRRAVARLVHDYALALVRYRRVVKSSFGSGFRA